MGFSWQGASGQWFEFDVARARRAWDDVGGIYMFVKPGDTPTMEAGGPISLFMGQTTSLADSLAQNPRWEASAALGAAEIHLMIEPDPAKRARIFDDLAKAQKPVVNQMFQSAGRGA
jgi:hypothetical protein